ncbi:hypothetical protein QUF80_02635 [Desulfococcaceae bacterium HSG8]|nr:hypothetical protein [Desulfococcaceae bacterium HSG8]
MTNIKQESPLSFSATPVPGGYAHDMAHATLEAGEAFSRRR